MLFADREASHTTTLPCEMFSYRDSNCFPTGISDCFPVVAAVVSTPDSDLREVSEHGSQSSGKKKVTFNMNVTIYENAVLPDQGEEPPEEDEKH